MIKKVKGPQTVRRFRKPRCHKGQRHVWVLGPATAASPAGQLFGARRSHLKGQCRRCHKGRAFHPAAALQPAFRKAA